MIKKVSHVYEVYQVYFMGEYFFAVSEKDLNAKLERKWATIYKN